MKQYDNQYLFPVLFVFGYCKINELPHFSFDNIILFLLLYVFFFSSLHIHNCHFSFIRSVCFTSHFICSFVVEWCDGGWSVEINLSVFFCVVVFCVVVVLVILFVK